MKALEKSLLVLSLYLLYTGLVYASEEKTTPKEEHFFGNLRVGYINAKDAKNPSSTSSAFGGKLGYLSDEWNGLKASGTVYATEKLFQNENQDFFGSDGKSYAILGQAFVQGNFAKTEITAGRFEIDTPFAEADDIRMIQNTFSGALFENNNIKNTTIYAAYLDQWSGVDSDKPQEFTDLNGNNGLFTTGAVYGGIENFSIQGWYYFGKELAQLAYAEVLYEIDDLVLGMQYSSQKSEKVDKSGPDGNVYGVMASYTLHDFTVTGAYNGVSGTITNGFGGGPFFTSAEDHTIADVLDQNAISAGLDYTGIDKLTLSILHVAFAKGSDETDITASYNFNDEMNIEAIYHHMHEDGDMLLVRFNVGF